MTVLSRKFIIIDDNNLDGYLNNLKNKIKKSNRNYDVHSLEELFQILKKTKAKNSEEFYNQKNKLKDFTEEFIIKNAYYISCVLNLSEEQRKIIMINFNYFNFNDSLDIINLLDLIIKKFKKIIYVYLDNILKNMEYDKDTYYDFAKSLEKRENKEFIGTIMDSFLNEYPMIKDYPIIGKLFMDLYAAIGDISFSYIVEQIDEIESQKYKPLNDHCGTMKKENLIRKIKKEQCQSTKKLY